MAINITRGTTPTITIHVPEDVDLATASEIWVTLKQQPKILTKKLTTGTALITGSDISINLTQAETLQFQAGAGGLIQVRILLSGGLALASQIERVNIYDVIQAGEIS